MTVAADTLITITERARREIRGIFDREHPEPGTALRLGVIGGGCSGLSYEMEFDQPRANPRLMVSTYPSAESCEVLSNSSPCLHLAAAFRPAEPY